MDTTEYLTIDQIISGAMASEVPPGDPDDHDMLVRLSEEIMLLREGIDALRAAAGVMADQPEAGMPQDWTAFSARFYLAQHLERITSVLLEGSRVVIKTDGKPAATWAVYTGG